MMMEWQNAAAFMYSMFGISINGKEMCKNTEKRYYLHLKEFCIVCGAFWMQIIVKRSPEELVWQINSCSNIKDFAILGIGAW